MSLHRDNAEVELVEEEDVQFVANGLVEIEQRLELEEFDTVGELAHS